MKTSRHCAAATKVATTWEAKWNKLRKSALEAVLYFIELGEKSDKRHKQELAEAKAALAKAHAAERAAVEERKNLTKRLADMESSLRNKEAEIEKLISNLNHANYELKWADIELSNLRSQALSPENGATITKLMVEAAHRTLEMDALKDRIRKMRTALLDQARYWDLILTHVSTATERAEAAKCAREAAGKEVEEW
jgi:chromosome segregation ATPase